MNHNTIMQLINKIKKRNHNKKKTNNKKKMKEVFKTKQNKTITLWNENKLLQDERDEIYDKIFNKK